MPEHTTNTDVCHCGRPTAVVTDPLMYETLGPAPKALCVACLYRRCDAYPFECHYEVIPPGEGKQ